MIIKKFGKGSTEKIIQLEQKFNITLPKQYKEFLQKYNGGEIIPELGEGIVLPVINYIVKPRVLFGIDTEIEENSIDYWMKCKVKDLPEKSLIIGRDGHGGFFVLLTSIEDKIIPIFWDDGNEVGLSNKNANSHILYDDFDDFWNGLDAKKIIDINEKGKKEMDRIDYLPLGSVVLLEEGVQKLLITSRGMNVKNGNNILYFDYAGVPYPQGLVNDEIVYFNHENIRKIVFKGFTDEDDVVIVDSINNYLEKNPDIVRGNADNWQS